jgi:hypothetical protein
MPVEPNRVDGAELARDCVDEDDPLAGFTPSERRHISLRLGPGRRSVVRPTRARGGEEDSGQCGNCENRA